MSSGPLALPSTTVSPGVFTWMSEAEIVAPLRESAPVLPARSSFATPENLPADVTFTFETSKVEPWSSSTPMPPGTTNLPESSSKKTSSAENAEASLPSSPLLTW